MKKIVRLTENDLTHLVKKVIEEQSILNEQLTLLSIPAPNISFGVGDTTKQIKLSGIDPTTKQRLVLKYNISGSYGFLGFDVELRNLRRDASGNLRGEAIPTNKTVYYALKNLVNASHFTPDKWLYVKVDVKDINEAINMLRKNKGASAKIDANHGVTIKLTRV